jgi:Ser/Thr protein kinase RdoA (MazF antagonist)
VTPQAVLVFDDIDGRHADLSPGSPDVGPVVTAIAALESALTPCPVPSAPAAAELAGLVHGWQELAAAPEAVPDDWARRHLDDLAAAETRWLAAADGKTLVHGDINASNLLIAGTREVFLIDWAQPACGAPWLDIADLVPHLILAGHTPARAERDSAGRVLGLLLGVAVGVEVGAGGGGGKRGVADAGEGVPVGADLVDPGDFLDASVVF